MTTSRRNFLKASVALGGGLALSFTIPHGAQAADAALSPEVNAWVVVRPDDTVVIRIVRSEMGQGTLTGLAQLVAEELDCDWARVTTEYPTPGQSLKRNRVWGSFSTGGSQGIRQSNEYVRKGGAAARLMLMQAAADAWGVPVAECQTAKGVISHTPTGRSTRYGAVADAAGKLPVPTNITLKSPAEWKLAGKRLARLDTADKTTGKQIYGMDLALPGMLNAAIKDCPVFGGTMASYQEEAVLALPGVKKVVRVGSSAVAVIADTWWRAKSALDALPVQWNEGPHTVASSTQFAEVLKAGLTQEQAVVGNENGNAKEALARAPAPSRRCIPTRTRTTPRWKP